MIKRRIQNEDGKAITIMGISLVVLVLLMGIFIVDFSKAVYIKNLYSSFALKAAQTAVKKQDAIGGLKPEAVETLINEYMKQRNGQAQNTADTVVHKSYCEALGKYPQIKITFDKGRKKGSTSIVYNSVNGSIPQIPDSKNFFRHQYDTIEVDLIDVVDNDFLGILGTSKACSELHIDASAISVSSHDEDEISSKLNKKP